jgi:hypothetical protein
MVDCNLGELHFGQEGAMPAESKALDAPSLKRPKIEDVTLTASEAARLIGICVELIELCAKVTGKIDPAVGSLVGYARDEALAEVLDFGS